MDQYLYKNAENILYDVWYTVAEKIIQRVINVVELSDEQVEALKSVTLRPNDFQIQIIED
jgi:hypothetical protein